MFDGVGVVEVVLEVEHGEDCVARVVVQDHGGTREVLVLHSPETDVLLAARDQLLRVDRRELYRHYVEIAQLLGDQYRLSCALDLTDIENQYRLTLV